MADQRIDGIIRDMQDALNRLKAVSGEEQKRTLTEAQLLEVLTRLRNRGLWGKPNDETVASMASATGGYTPATAFAVLTEGNAAIARVIAGVLDGEPDSTIVEPEPDLVPDVEPVKRRRPGRRAKPKPEPAEPVADDE